MSIVTMILGESGTGKTASLRNFSPQDTLLIQPLSKPLPFRSKQWSVFNKETNPKGNIFQTDQAADIIRLLQNTKRPVIVVDDFQYIMANEFMRRVTDAKTKNSEFEKFSEIGKNTWDILRVATDLPAGKRVYLLSHTEKNEDGSIKAKTIGRLLDQKVGMEGMVTIVLRTLVRDGSYLFATRNNGMDTTKSPMGLFESESIDNDLCAVDAAIVDYYGSEAAPEPTAPAATRNTELPDYPQENLGKNAQELRNLFDSGRTTPKNYIIMLSSKYRLSDEQKAQILDLGNPQ